jgi:hypothetical protein
VIVSAFVLLSAAILAALRPKFHLSLLFRFAEPPLSAIKIEYFIVSSGGCRHHFTAASNSEWRYRRFDARPTKSTPERVEAPNAGQFALRRPLARFGGWPSRTIFVKDGPPPASA